MSFPVRRPLPSIAALTLTACLLGLSPRSALALPLLDAELSLDDGSSRPLLSLATEGQSKESKASKTPAKGDGSLDFDLLGKPPPTATHEIDASMHRRRSMLNWHQGIGIGLYALELATTVVGQLNYSDKYGSNAPITAKYEATHAALAFTTVGVFAVNGAIALLAPAPRTKTSHGFDRVSLHKLGMGIATAGMAAQAGIGIYTNSREGYLNQEKWAKTHLAIGYATLAAMSMAVGALVF